MFQQSLRPIIKNTLLCRLVLYLKNKPIFLHLFLEMDVLFFKSVVMKRFWNCLGPFLFSKTLVVSCVFSVFTEVCGHRRNQMRFLLFCISCRSLWSTERREGRCFCLVGISCSWSSASGTNLSPVQDPTSMNSDPTSSG